MGNDRRRGWREGLPVSAAAGLLAGLALPPLGWPWLLWPALALLWSLADSPAGPDRRTPGRGLAWGLAAVLVSHRWLLALHPLDWIGVPSPLSLPICLLLWLLCGLLGGLLVQVWLLLVRRLGPTRADTALIGAVLWGLAEVVLARGPLFWLGLGAAALPGDPDLAGMAALGGAGALAAVQLLLGWCLWRALALPTRGWRWLLSGAALLLAAQLAGRLTLARPPLAGGSERLLVIQPAIPTRRKFEAQQQRRLLALLEAGQERAAGGDAAATSVLLPEGALPLGRPLPGPAAVEVLSGGFRWDGARQLSSVLRFPAGSRLPDAWVDKHRVVPLGEWVPQAGWLRWSGLSAVGGIEPGARPRLLTRPAGPIGVAICYEVSDGTALAAASREGARWLLLTANLDPYPAMLQRQFTALARLRAIETGRWLVSAANTGPSLLVDPAGRLRQALPAGIATMGTMTVAQGDELTPYVRWRETPLLALLLLGTALRLAGRGGGAPASPRRSP